MKMRVYIKASAPKKWVRTPINQKSGPFQVYKYKKLKHKKRLEEEDD